MDRFPKMLYRFPGVGPVAVALDDGAYDTLVVADEDAHDDALADGWHETSPEARAEHERLLLEPVQAAINAGDKAADTSDDGQPVTRDELKAKATELGIEFARNVTNERLAELIAAKLQA